MHIPKSIRFDQARASLLTVALAATLGCGGASNSEKKTDSGAAGGSGGVVGGGSGGGMGVSAGGAGGTGGAGTGGTVGTPDGGSCTPLANLSLAVHIVLDATWPGSTATNPGSGQIHLWNLTQMTVSNGQLEGQTVSCQNRLPEFALNGAGQLVTGGSRILVEIPNAVWDAPTIPKFRSSGSIAGWNVGDMITINGTVALVGLMMSDPLAAWPSSYTEIQAVDSDGDGKPGISAVPRSGGGYVLPPTGLGLLGSAPAADRVYLASRTVVGLAGRLTSCSDIAGTGNVMFFDSHVVGCHVSGGNDCTAPQTDFVDQSRTAYQVTSGTFTAKRLADGATCADARAAIP